MDLAELVKKAQHGDKDALVQLIMDRKAEYYRLAYIYVKNEEDALDIMQDMILILYQNIHRLKKEDSFYSWSKTILVNCCKRYLKMKGKTILINRESEFEKESVFEDKDVEEEMIIEKCMSHLSRKHQEVIKMRYFLDMDYKAIAKILKIPIGTVKSRINAGIKNLKRMVEVEMNE